MLTDARYRNNFDSSATVEEIYEHLYWHAAGKDYKTGKKSTLIRLFEERYKSEFINAMASSRNCNIYSKYLSLPDADQKDETLIAAMRHYDHTVNIAWVMAHYHAAAAYLDKGNKETEGTGGSNWKKYMHPRYQRRIFFPLLWSKEELDNWGNDV